MTDSTIADVVVYWRPGCPFCASLTLRMRLARIPFRQINIWTDDVARQVVRDQNNGDELVPTVQIGRTFLRNPSVATIRKTRRLTDNAV